MTNHLVKNEYYLGLDLGRKQDHSALIVLERCQRAVNTRYVDSTTEWEQRLAVRYAKQWKLGTPYGDVAKEVGVIYRKIELLGKPILVVDQTGVGDAVFEMIKGQLRGANLEGVVINQELKRDMYAAMETNLEQGKLQIALDCQAAKELQQELLTVEIRRVGYGYKYGAFEKNAHDDLVMALAMACWRERIGIEEFRPNTRLPGF